MRGMILAAGRGTRMGSLTMDTPKPLLRVGGRYLIEYSIDALTRIGIQEIVINVSYRREQIKVALGDGAQFGVTIQYSEEIEALETGGGILQALPLLGKEPFIVLSGDVVSNFPLETLPTDPKELAHIVLVDNPVFHPQGDFGLFEDTVCLESAAKLTYANIGVYRPELFVNCRPGKFYLGDVLKQAIAQKKVTGEYFKGWWHNLGSPQELAELCGVLENPPYSASGKDQ